MPRVCEQSGQWAVALVHEWFVRCCVRSTTCVQVSVSRQVSRSLGSVAAAL
jgi:hypothetical protein